MLHNSEARNPSQREDNVRSLRKRWPGQQTNEEPLVLAEITFRHTATFRTAFKSSRSEVDKGPRLLSTFTLSYDKHRILPRLHTEPSERSHDPTFETFGNVVLIDDWISCFTRMKQLDLFCRVYSVTTGETHLSTAPSPV